MLALLPMLLGCPSPSPSPQTPQPTPKPDDDKTWALQVEPRRTEVGHRFGLANPLRIRWRVDTRIAGEGLPPWDDSTGTPILPPGVPAAVDASVVQLAVPVRRRFTDEEASNESAAGFPFPRLCVVGEPCIHARGTAGRWHAHRIRRGRETELQLGPVSFDLLEDDVPNDAVIGLWLDDGDPLEPGDEVVFSFTGSAPRRSDAWLDQDVVPLLRHRTRDGWKQVRDTRGLRLEPRPAQFARVVAPLDTTKGAPFTVQLMTLDDWANPSPVRDTFDLEVDGEAVATVALDGFRTTTTLTLRSAGTHRIRAVPRDTRGVSVVGAVTQTRAAPRWSRLVGDMHIHSGDGSGPRGFPRSNQIGDHAGQFTRGDLALTYLAEVGGHDFGALSEHASPVADLHIPADPVFQPGGICEIRPTPATPHDWWRLSQEVSQAFDEARSDFTAFPAYEWHGHMALGPLHRVVLFRDFDSRHRLPLYPGTDGDRRPQCLVRFLAAAGLTSQDVLALPHMMTTKDNYDWNLSYAGGTVADQIASPDQMNDFQRGAEVFSARNLSGQFLFNARILKRFEGSLDDPEPHTLRHGWQLGARVGVTGASDNHGQQPGANDFAFRNGKPNDALQHAHEPTGLTVVLADPRGNRRDAIFDAMHARRMYATSGVRVWLDYTAEHEGSVYPMGSAFTATTCQATLAAEITADKPVASLQLYGSPLDPNVPWTVLDHDSDGERSAQLSTTITGTPGETWLYYVRAVTGTRLEVQDGAWSSPIWITWPGTC